MIFPSSNVTTADTWRPSAVVSSNSSPSLNFNSMDFKVVEVLMVQAPPSSDISTVGVDTVAAFLSNMFTSRAFRKSSYFSADVRSNLPLNASIFSFEISLVEVNQASISPQQHVHV